MPLAYSYFAEQRPDVPPGSLIGPPKAAMVREPLPTPRLFLSECQLLVSDPGAAPQIWHRDNRQPGLTMILPLTEVDDSVGPTQLLPGTHHMMSGCTGSLLEAAS